MLIAPEVSVVELQGKRCGIVQPSNSHAPPLPADSLTAVVWRPGYMSAISGSTFSSQVLGWPAPPRIGGFCLDTVAHDNTIEYSENQPPFQAPLSGAQHDTNQIFDANGQHTIIRMFAKVPAKPIPVPRTLPFGIWPVDHWAPAPEQEIPMRRTLEIALDRERHAHPDFADLEEDLLASRD